MEKVDTQALNKKLAQWAGLCWHEYPMTPSCSVLRCRKCGKVSIEEDNPDFVNSLDDCFKLLVPKITDPYITFQERQAFIWATTGTTIITNTWGRDRKPSLALCLAISKLIDVEE